jgi:hypothetical protein
LRIYHLTQAENVAKILTEGFVDTTNHEGKTGVWFSVPASSRLVTMTREADTVVSLEVPDEVLEQYERERVSYPNLEQFAGGASLREMIAQDDWREFCIPAAEVNQYRDTLEQSPLDEHRSEKRY